MIDKEKINGQNTFFVSQGDTEAPFPEDGRPSSRFLEEYPRRFGKWVAGMEEGGEKKEELERISRLGRQIERLRAERHLSRQELAEYTGVDLDLLFFFEKGLVSPTEASDILEKVRQGMEVDLSSLEALVQEISRNGYSDPMDERSPAKPVKRF